MYEITTPNGYAAVETAVAARNAVRLTVDEYPGVEGDQVTVRRGGVLRLWLRFDGRRWRRLDRKGRL